MSSKTIEYFGYDTVSRAVANYFMQHGVYEQVRDRLIEMETQDSDEFFEMVSEFVEKQG